MNRRVIVIAVLAVLAIGSWLVLEPAQQPDSVPGADDLEAGYYLTDADISDTDDAGELLYSLKAERIDHNPRDESVNLETLQLLYIVTAGEPWLIRATEGWMAGDRAQMILRGEVQISGAFNNQQSAAVISTTRLILDLNEDIARTNETVQIDVGGASLEADGLHADLKNQKIQLLSNVRGTFNAGS